MNSIRKRIGASLAAILVCAAVFTFLQSVSFSAGTVTSSSAEIVHVKEIPLSPTADAWRPSGAILNPSALYLVSFDYPDSCGNDTYPPHVFASEDHFLSDIEQHITPSYHAGTNRAMPRFGDSIQSSLNRSDNGHALLIIQTQAMIAESFRWTDVCSDQFPIPHLEGGPISDHEFEHYTLIPSPWSEASK